MECCGIESGSEFNSTVTNWNTTYVYQSGGSYTVATATIPLTCCEFSNKDAFPTDVTTFYNSMTNNQCPINQANSYYNQVKLHTLISFQLSSSVFTTKLQSKLFFRKKKNYHPLRLWSKFIYWPILTSPEKGLQTPGGRINGGMLNLRWWKSSSRTYILKVLQISVLQSD